MHVHVLRSAQPAKPSWKVYSEAPFVDNPLGIFCVHVCMMMIIVRTIIQLNLTHAQTTSTMQA